MQLCSPFSYLTGHVSFPTGRDGVQAKLSTWVGITLYSLNTYRCSNLYLFGWNIKVRATMRILSEILFGETPCRLQELSGDRWFIVDSTLAFIET
jgi:hypothetical protein